MCNAKKDAYGKRSNPSITSSMRSFATNFEANPPDALQRDAVPSKAPRTASAL
jgi:hypothetical protein